MLAEAEERGAERGKALKVLTQNRHTVTSAHVLLCKVSQVAVSMWTSIRQQKVLCLQRTIAKRGRKNCDLRIERFAWLGEGERDRQRETERKHRTSWGM